MDVGGTEGVDAGRGAVEGGSGTNAGVVLGVRAMVVGAAVVGAAVVGATVVDTMMIGAAVVGRVVGATVVDTMVIGAAVVGAAGGAEGTAGGVRGTNGVVPVGRPGVVADVGEGGLVGAGATVVVDTGAGEDPGALITRPSGGTTRGCRFGTCVVAVALSDRDFLAGRVAGTAVVVVERGITLVDGAAIGLDGSGTVTVATIPSGGTTWVASDSRNNGRGRASGTVAVEA